MLEKFSDDDPKGLIFEAYRLDLGLAEARTIFMDWALGWPAGTDTAAMVPRLYARFAPLHPDHPMTAVLRDGLGAMDAPKGRKGGRSGKRRQNPDP